MFLSKNEINFLIASFVSADANLDNDDRKQNIKNLQILYLKFKDKMTDDQKKLCNKSIDILKKEYIRNWWKDSSLQDKFISFGVPILFIIIIFFLIAV